MGLLVGLEGKRHYFVLDNFFNSIQLFKDLVVVGIHATSFDFSISSCYATYFEFFCIPLIWLQFWQSFLDIFFISIVAGM